MNTGSDDEPVIPVSYNLKYLTAPARRLLEAEAERQGLPVWQITHDLTMRDYLEDLDDWRQQRSGKPVTHTDEHLRQAMSDTKENTEMLEELIWQYLGPGIED